MPRDPPGPESRGEPVAGTPRTEPLYPVSQENLTRLLAAELYGYRGDLQRSVRYYLEAAHSTRDVAVLERATRVALHARDYEAADRLTRTWLEEDPEDPEVYLYRVRLELHAGEIAAALRHFEQLLEWGVGDRLRGALRLLAESLEGTVERGAVLQMLRGLEARHLEQEQVMSALFDLLVRLEKSVEVRLLARYLVDLAPRSDGLAISYVEYLSGEDELEAALVWLENHLAETDSPGYEPRLARAQLLYSLERSAEAIAVLEKVERDHPERFEVLYRLGLLYMGEEQWEQALDSFQRLSEHREFRDESHYYLGVLAEERKDLEQARRHYEQVRAGERLPFSQARAGYLAGGAGRLKEARRRLQDLSRLYWHSAERRNLFLNTEAQLLLDVERYEESLAVYDGALARLGYDSDLLYGRAMMAEQMNRLDQLEYSLRGILEREPDHIEALNALGYTLADRTHRYREAYELIRRAMDLGGRERAHIIDSMGWVLYRMGRPEEALTYLRRAYEQVMDAEIAAHLGEVLWLLEQHEEARAVWQEALQQEPEHGKLLRVIQRFIP